jgi:hypothetical protein
MKKVLFALSLMTIGFNSYAQPPMIGGYIHKDDTTVLPKYPAYKVWLIEYNSTAGTLTAVDSVSIAANSTVYPRQYGFYSSVNMTSTYMVKAAITNGPTSGTGYVPTYDSSAIFWSSANAHKWTSMDSVNRHIWMVKGTVSSGPGFIGGSIAAGANKSTAPGDPIPSMTVYLLNATGTALVQSTVTDATGAFSFSNVANGTYKVYPEDGGSATTAVTVTISTSTANITHVDFEKSFANKTIKPRPSGIITVADDKIFSVYPNPASNNLTVKLNTSNTSAHVVMLSTEGRVVLSQDVKLSNQSATINVAAFAKGSYFVTVQDGAKVSTQRVVLQ